ncbi:hypothetical protein H6F76_17825 [Leptolyngbya sp. FACHB-321]|uniref:NACHT domain-containing protein n=1 Tax=Leptolyngbya sp. FACHB-321 TaxID=2692807 RepID=UPI001682AD0A|nr:hypothetical protein [Leptolyngbya sp. FACHB-321]MBD2036871.1 hypothetical protein [Leptolyngbya sp. FACHB-321]
MKQPGDQQADRDIFNIDNKGTVTVINQPVPQRARSESLLLQAVKQEVISRLDQSLHNAVFINLGKQSQPQQIKPPWDAEIKIGSKSPEPLPTETTILEVFDRPGIDGRLLILGEPGAGKTTTMLDLAKALCDRAEQDTNAFIPILLNLSSWKDPRQTMTAWLVEELRSKYGVRKDIGKQWLADRQLLPLLDELDEVKPEHQEGCVQAINRWLESEDRPLSLVVCCRREEYEKVVRGQWQVEAEEAPDEIRMHLNGAILLQTLTDEQIQAYLTAANQLELWQMLRQDEALWELIRTPLWLSITLLAYEGLSLNQWQQTASTEQRLALLLNAYIERMLHKEPNSRTYAKRKLPTVKQTRRWLVSLAQQQQQQSQTEFLIERMQPLMLSKGGLWKYQLLLGLIHGLLVGSLFGILCGLVIGLINGLCYGLKVWFFVGLLVGLGNGLNSTIQPIDRLKWSWKNFVGGLLIGLSCGVFYGLVIRSVFEPIFGQPFGLLVGLLVGLSNGLLVVFLFGLRGEAVDVKSSPNQGIKRSTVSFVIVWLTFALLGGLGQGLFVGLFVGLGLGGEACIQHSVLRLVLYQNKVIPWNYARFLDYCTERLFLQRVGGRYRFIHKSLQEHFARMGE